MPHFAQNVRVTPFDELNCAGALPCQRKESIGKIAQATLYTPAARWQQRTVDYLSVGFAQSAEADSDAPISTASCGLITVEFGMFMASFCSRLG